MFPYMRVLYRGYSTSILPYTPPLRYPLPVLPTGALGTTVPPELTSVNQYLQVLGVPEGPLGTGGLRGGI